MAQYGIIIHIVARFCLLLILPIHNVQGTSASSPFQEDQDSLLKAARETEPISFSSSTTTSNHQVLNPSQIRNRRSSQYHNDLNHAGLDSAFLYNDQIMQNLFKTHTPQPLNYARSNFFLDLLKPRTTRYNFWDDHSLMHFGKRSVNENEKEIKLTSKKSTDEIANSFGPNNDRYMYDKNKLDKRLSDPWHSVMSFGKKSDNPWEHNTLHFGKKDDPWHNMMSFGKKSDNLWDHNTLHFGKKDEPWHNMMSFGKKSEENEPYETYDKRTKPWHSTLSLGKKDDPWHNMMSFGKRYDNPWDHNTMHFGKKNEPWHNMMSFGKRYDNLWDHNTMHFGKKDEPWHNMMSFGKRNDNPWDHNTMHFGKKDDTWHNIMSFGKKSEQNEQYESYDKLNEPRHNTLSFGKKDDPWHNMLNFGKRYDNPWDHTTLHFGKRQQPWHSTMSFGKRENDEDDIYKREDPWHNMMSFGKKNEFAWNNATKMYDKRDEPWHNMMSFGKRTTEGLGGHSTPLFGKYDDLEFYTKNNNRLFLEKKDDPWHNMMSFGKKSQGFSFDHNTMHFGKRSEPWHSIMSFGKRTDNFGDQNTIYFGKEDEALKIEKTSGSPLGVESLGVFEENLHDSQNTMDEKPDPQKNLNTLDNPEKLNKNFEFKIENQNLLKDRNLKHINKRSADYWNNYNKKSYLVDPDKMMHFGKKSARRDGYNMVHFGKKQPLDNYNTIHFSKKRFPWDSHNTMHFGKKLDSIDVHKIDNTDIKNKENILHKTNEVNKKMRSTTYPKSDDYTKIEKRSINAEYVDVSEKHKTQNNDEKKTEYKRNNERAANESLKHHETDQLSALENNMTEEEILPDKSILNSKNIHKNKLSENEISKDIQITAENSNFRRTLKSVEYPDKVSSNDQTKTTKNKIEKSKKSISLDNTVETQIHENEINPKFSAKISRINKRSAEIDSTNIFNEERELNSDAQSEEDIDDPSRETTLHFGKRSLSEDHDSTEEANSYYPLTVLEIPSNYRSSKRTYPWETQNVLHFGKRVPWEYYNMLHFGKHDPLESHNTMHFGKRDPFESHNTMHFGKRDPFESHNTMHFGKRDPFESHNTMHFGKRDPWDHHNTLHFGKRASWKYYPNMHFGKKFDPWGSHYKMHFGKRSEDLAYNVLHFGKKNADGDGRIGPYIDFVLPSSYGKHEKTLDTKNFHDLLDTLRLWVSRNKENAEQKSEYWEDLEQLRKAINEQFDKEKTDYTLPELKKYLHLILMKILTKHAMNDENPKNKVSPGKVVLSDGKEEYSDESSEDLDTRNLIDYDYILSNEPKEDDPGSDPELTENNNLRSTMVKRNSIGRDLKRFWAPFQGPKSIVYPHAWFASQIRRSQVPRTRELVRSIDGRMAAKKEDPFNSYMHFGKR